MTIIVIIVIKREKRSEEKKEVFRECALTIQHTGVEA
jgi:hypothetical protein